MEQFPPLMNGMIEVEPIDDPGIDRRDLLRGAGTLAAFIGTANAQSGAPGPPDGQVPQASSGPPLATVPFGKFKISRLIAGANPIYGYSHFNYVFSAHMGEYHSTARVLAFLRELERAGLNTWQASWSERLETDWLKYKEQGGKLQLLLLSRPNFNDQPEMLNRAVKLNPLGIAQHGASTNRFWDMKQMDRSLDFLKRIRDLGVMVGLSCHNPLEVDYSEQRHWDVDYYMTSLYYINRPRAEFERILGQVPMGEIYLPADPPKMMETIRRTPKPCLAYKVLAAGRAVNSPKQVNEHLAAALNGIKPTDPVIIGLYQRFNDQIGQTAQMMREIASPSKPA
ncbi:MAG: hypothetical protein C0504_10710 [Candidatus Solibacter sp.]|nr:hypothetical protein [Candidatus Solibacter sp.]